jgi:NADP-dependent 3-hydroxy acid dehydrogenase YdfG
MEIIKTALVTGANKGIGFEITKKLLAMNYNVVLACRNLDFAKKAVEDLNKLKDTKSALNVLQLDVSDSESITSAIKVLQASNQKFDLLINNAGVYYKNGLESDEKGDRNRSYLCRSDINLFT